MSGGEARRTAATNDAARDSEPLRDLLELMARLRDPERGCPWDRAQTFATIAPYTIEEAYEVADAIESGSAERLRGELGDLLFQVVFHARLAEERSWFAFDDVAASIRDKLVRRHPHVFGGAGATDAATLSTQWEAHKAQERAEAAAREANPDRGVLADIPLALPALTRAAKLGKRAGRVGFDWPDATGARDKVTEELREIDAALAASGGQRSAAVEEEFGDLLLALASWGRLLGLDAEKALRAANGKFEARFRRMEALARARGIELDEQSAAAWDALWTEAKTPP